MYSSDSSSTTIASIQIASALDTSGFYKDLKQLDRIDLPELRLKPTVDFRQLHDLNKLFDVKARHAEATNRKLKLKPTVDLSGLGDLHKGLDAINREIDRTRRNARIDLTFNTSGVDAVEKRIAEIKRSAAIDVRVTGGGSLSSGSGSSRQGDSKLAQQIGAEVGKAVKSGGIGRAIGGAIQLPFKIAGGAISEVGKSLLFGVSQEVTKGFGKGLNSAIERSISGSIGSTELAGESIGDALAKGLTGAINKRVPGALSEVQDALKEALGEDAITKAGLFSRSQQRRDQQRRVAPIREQATVERRDLLRERIGVQSRVQNVQSSIASVQSEYQRGERLRTRLQNQSLREQILGASPQRLAQFDTTIGSLNKQLDALSQQERDLNDVLANVTQELETFDKRLEQSKKTVQSVAPKQTPLAYRQAIEQVAGRKVSELQIPRIVVADDKLKAQNARAVYGIESNTLQVTSEMKAALDSGKLTFEQMTDLFHELQHAMDFAFGSFEGVQSRREGQILTKPTQATPSELREIAPLINQYNPSERSYEINAEILGRRNARSAFTQQQRQSAIGNLYQSVGYGGANVQNFASKQIDATGKQLQAIRNLANQLGIDVGDTLKDFTQTFGRISQSIEDLSNQSVQLDNLDPEKIEGIAGQFKAQFQSLEQLQSIVDRFQSQFVQRGRAVQQGQQIKSQAQQQLDGVQSILDTVSKRSFDLNVAVGKRFGEIQDAYKLLNDDIEETLKSAAQQSDITPESMEQMLAGSLEGVGMLQEAAENYQAQFEKRVKATRFGRGVRSTVQSVGNAAQTAGGVIGSGMRNLNDILQSPQGQALVKGLNAATRSVEMLAVGGYKLAEGFESLALDLMPAGRLIKGTLQQTVVPAALFGAATHLLPGGEAAAQGLVHLAQSAGNPLLESASSGMAGQAVDFIQSAVPHVMGLQNTIASAATQAIESGVSTVGGLVIQAGTVVLGGKALQTAATLPLKAATGQKPLPMLLPRQQHEKETIALPVASGQIAKQQPAEIEQSNKELAKKAAYRAGLTTRQALDSATKTIDVISQSVKSGSAVTADAVAQAKTIGAKFTDAYATFKEQSKKGNTQLAKAHAQTILDISEQAIKEIDKLIKDLKSEGVDTNFAKTLGGTLQGIKGQVVRKQNLTRTYVEKNAGVTPYIDVSASSELESKRLQMPRISQEQIADLGINAVGAITSALAGQHGIVAELAGDLVGALGARVTYQVGKAGVKAYSGVKQDPAYAAMTALEKFSKLMNEISNELQSDFVQKEFGNQLTGDLSGFAIGNATRLAANTVEGLSGIPLKGAAAAMLTVPQIQKLREQISQRIAIEQGGSPELESKRLDLNKLRGSKGLSEAELNQLKALNELLEKAEKAADMAEAALGRMGKEANQAFNQSQEGVEKAIEAFENGEEAANNTAKALGGLGGVAGFALKGFLAFKAIEFIAPLFSNFAKSSLDAAIEFDKFNILLEAGLGSASKAKQTYADLSAEAQDLGFNLKGAIEGQAGLAAATRDTSYEGYATEVIGAGGRAAAAAYGLSGADTQGLFTAYGQILGKNRVQAEELRGQIAERLPGAFQIFARSIGVTTAELDKMLQKGQVGIQEFIQFNQQLVVETSSTLEKTSQTTQAALNRVENSTFKLQTTFGKFLQPGQTAALNTLASTLDLVNNNIGEISKTIGAGALMAFAPLLIQGAKQLGVSVASLIFQVTGLSTAFKLLQAGASSQVLLQFMAQVKTLPALLATIRTGVISVGSAVAALGAKFALAYAAITAVQVVMEQFSDQSGELGKIAERSAKRLDDLRDSIKGVKDETGREDLNSGGTTGWLKNLIPEDPIPEEQRNQGFFGDVRNSFSRLGKEALLTTIARPIIGQLDQNVLNKQQKAYEEFLKSIEASTQGTISKVDDLIAGLDSNTIATLNRLDKKIQENQSKQRVLRVQDPGNTEELRRLQQEERKLQEERGNANKNLAEYQSKLQSTIDDIKASKDELKQKLDANNISQQDYNEGIGELDDQLAQAESAFERLNDSIGSGTKRMAELSKELEKVAAKMEDANEVFERSQNASRSNIARLRSSTALSPGQVQAMGDNANIQALEQKLAANQAELKRINAVLQSPEYSTVLSNLGIKSTDQIGRGTLNQLLNQYSEENSPERNALLALQQRNEAGLGLSGLQADIDEARANAIDSAKASAKEFEEFFRSFQRSSEDLNRTIEQFNIDAKVSRVQTAFKRNLTAFGDEFLGDFFSAIDELFSVARERTQVERERAERETQSQRDAADRARSVDQQGRQAYSTSGFAAYQVVTPSGVVATSANQLEAHHDYQDSKSGLGRVYDFTLTDPNTGSVRVGVPSPVAGTVDLVQNDPGGYGNFLDVRGADNRVIRIAHLDSISVEEGQEVALGDVLGVQGNTGNTSGAGSTDPDAGVHVHIEAPQDILDRYIPMLSQGMQPASSQPSLSSRSTAASSRSSATQLSTEEFYRLATLSTLEAATPQGRADVAQSVFNRLNSGNYGPTVTDVLYAPGQYEPFFNASPSEITDAESAAQFLSRERGYGLEEARSIIQETTAILGDVGAMADAAQFVGGRTDFKGTSQYAYMQSDDRLRQQGENFFHNSGSQSQTELDRYASMAPGAVVPTGGSVTQSGVGASSAQLNELRSQNQQDADRYVAASNDFALSEQERLDLQQSQAEARARRGLDTAVETAQERNTETRRQQEGLILQRLGTISPDFASTLNDLRQSDQDAEDSTRELAKREQSLGESVANLEGTIEFYRNHPDASGANLLPEMEQKLPELQSEYEQLQTLIATDQDTRSQARQEILNRATQADQENLTQLQDQTRQNQSDLAIARTSDPVIRQLMEGRAEANRLTSQFTTQINNKRKEALGIEQEMQRLQEQGVQFTEAQLQYAQQSIDLRNQEADELERQLGLQQEINREQQLAALNQFRQDQGDALYQSRLQYMQNTGVNQFDINAFQRQNARADETARYASEQAQIQAYGQQLGLPQQEIQGLLGDASELNQINLSNINAQFADLGTTINSIARDGFGSLLSSIDDVILNGGKITDVFDRVSKEVISSLLDIGMQLLQSEIWGAFNGRGQQNNATGLAGGAMNIISTLAGGAGGGIGAAISGSGKAATPKGSGGTDWLSSLFSIGMSLAGGFAEGGQIPGTFTGQTDRVPALVTEGEFIINRVSAQKHLPLLEAINSNSIPRFATGGMVGGMPTPPRIPRSPVAPSMPTMPRDAASSMGDRNQEPIPIKYEQINDVSYVRKDEFERGMNEAAKRGAQGGRDLAFRQMQQSPNTRRGLGMQ